jgi:hypothetical protein
VSLLNTPPHATTLPTGRFLRHIAYYIRNNRAREALLILWMSRRGRLPCPVTCTDNCTVSPPVSISPTTTISVRTSASRTFPSATSSQPKHQTKLFPSSKTLTSPSIRSTVTQLSKFRSDYTNFLVMAAVSCYKRPSLVFSTSTRRILLSLQ